MFRSTSLFIGTSFTVAVFTIFATSNVDSIVGVPHKIYSMQRILIHIKNRPLLNVPICTQGMERTWWPEAGTIIVTGPYWPDVTVLLFTREIRSSHLLTFKSWHELSIRCWVSGTVAQSVSVHLNWALIWSDCFTPVLCVLPWWFITI